LILLTDATAQESHADTLTIKLVWKGLKYISIGDENFTQTFDIKNALYLGEYNYLPVVESAILPGRISHPQVVRWKGDTLSGPELQSFHLRDITPTLITSRTLSEPDSSFSTILLFPFIYDSISDNYYKITETTVVYRSEPRNAKLKTSTHSFRVSSSVLSKNEFYQIGVVENGVYQIDKNYLRQLGIDADRINPKRIKIYGNGGGMLPQSNGADRPTDLNENAIEVIGEEDGKFDEEDYILFYGQSQHKLAIDGEDEIFYSHNIYADTTYYFLTADGENGKRIEQIQNISGTYPEIETYKDLQVHELNENNILNSGREWFGEKFDAILNRNYNFNTRGIVEGSDVKVIASVLGQSLESTTMEFKYNNSALGEISFDAIPDGSYFTKGFIETKTFTAVQGSDASDESIVNLKFNKISGIKSQAYLNYLVFECEKDLSYDNSQLIFRSPASLEQPISKYSIKNATAGLKIWNAANPLDPKDQQIQLSGSIATFNATSDSLQEYIMFDPDKAEFPVPFGSVANQDIKSKPVPDLLIVTHPLFYNEAKRLAQHRATFDNLDVLVVTTQQVYNEFSSGAQDITAIRDMARHFYLKGNQTKLKNLLLFGKTSFDYKNRIKDNTDFVPTYSSRNSVHPVSSYSSDDYFGFMEDDEGEWQESYSGDHTLDIGVGRLPVKTVEEAKGVVDKLINYDENLQTLGEWKNEIFFIADDGDANLHQRDADNLATYIDTTYTEFNVNKIYVDAFEQIETSLGETAPEVNKTIENSIIKGAMIVNFTGHGSETRWCSETVLNISMIDTWENLDKLPMFVTATCEFGRHDEPRLVSGGEHLLLNPNGGAIGLVTTSRPVFSNSNYDINYAFYRSVFEKGNDNEYQDLGTIFKNTKNRSLRGSNNRNFSLLGDPSMHLALAKNDIQVTADIDEGIKIPGDTLTALETIKIKGKITDNFGANMANYNGILTAKVFDQQKSATTFGTESDPFTYKVRNSLIFNGDVSIDDGQFSFEFIVPKTLSDSFEEGKISFYAKNNTIGEDAAGSDVSFVVGGNSDLLGDNTPPEINLFINDTSFQNLGITGSDIITLGKIFDASGINILNNEMNEGMVLSLDNQDFKYVGDFFKNDVDTYQTGWLNYPISELEEGYHKITVGAYDTYNNYAENEIEFYVADSREFYADKLINYPNPLRDYTLFSFEHNRAGEDLEINLIIFDLKGKQVFNGTKIIANSPGKIDNLSWNGSSGNGKKLESGVYVYTIKIRSLKDNSNYFLKNKLLIIN